MKVLLLSFIILFSITTRSQVNFDEIDWENEGVGIDAFGHMNNPDSITLALLLDKDYERIKDNLYHQKAAYQFLSVVVIRLLKRKREITLTKLERLRIQEIKKSEKTFHYFSGCFYVGKIPLNQVLNKKGIAYVFYQETYNFYKFKYEE